MNYFFNIFRGVFSSVRLFFRREIPYGRTYLLFLSILTGIISGLLAVFLKYATKSVHRYTVSYASEHPSQLWLLPLLPLLGIFACVFLVRLFMQNKPYEKSLTAVIKTSADGSSQLPFYHTFAHLITTSLSVGTGISAGLEAPIVLTGSAVGANLGKRLKISSESRTLLISCGGAAGIAAAFNSPVAGILFAGEVLLPSFSTSALVPLLLASASGSIVAHFFYTGETFIQFNAQWQAVNIPFYLLIGLCCGIFSAYTIKINTLVTKYLSSKENVWLKAVLGATLLYPMFFFLPALLGEGYTFINALALGDSDALLKNTVLEGILNYKASLLPMFMLILCLLKPLASAVSLESGGDGGIFGPSLCLGAF